MAAYVLFLVVTIFIACVSVSLSETVVLSLTNSLSTTQFNSTHHLLKSTSARSASRFLQRRRQVSLSLSPGSDYTLSFSLGSDSPQRVSLYMDTGSDVVWLPCSPFSCILCDGKYDPAAIPYSSPLNLSSSSSSSSAVTCQSRACSAAHSHLSTSDLCAVSRCPLDSIEMSECSDFSCPPFYYAYGDGSLIARLFSDDLAMPVSSPSLVVKNFTFGCAHSTIGEPIGVAGFGRGVLSFPAQLGSFSPQLGNQFSYCLVSHSFDSDRVRQPSPLILGRYERKEREFGGDGYASAVVYTPMLENPKHSYFYTIGLEGVTVGKRHIPAPESLTRIDGEGNGGMVVDSGTTFSTLPKKLYDSVVTEFEKRVGRFYRRASRVEDKTGLGPCYETDSSLGMVVPPLVFHFGGNSSVAMPRGNFFYEFSDGGDDGKKRRVGCLMLMNGGDVPDSSGPAGLLGNYQQQGFEVVYDLESNRVGFARRKCASLYDSLNRS